MSVKTLLKLNKLFRVPEHPFNEAGVASGRQNTADLGASLAYAQWEYDRAEASLACYAPFYAPGDILFRKKVLDVGCGAGGKSVWYAQKYKADVFAVDVVKSYEDQAERFAEKLGVSTVYGVEGGCDRDAVAVKSSPNAGSDSRGRYADAGSGSHPVRFAGGGSFRFILADAADTGFADETFDTIIMNDAFEHLADPEAVLKECARLLRPGGRLFLNFPPYGHPYGAHLSDLIGIPWVHRLFSEKDCIEAYRQLADELDERTGQSDAGGPKRPAADSPEQPNVNGPKQVRAARPAVSGAERIAFRFTEDEEGTLRNTYINKMTVKRFKDILQKISGTGSRRNTKTADYPPAMTSQNGGPADPPLQLKLYREKPLRGWLLPAAKIPGLKENFVRMVVCVLEKP